MPETGTIIVVLLEAPFFFPEPPPTFLLTRETVPVLLTADCGAKMTLKLTDCPGDKFIGRLGPLMLNPVPDTVAWEICSFDGEILLTTVDWLDVMPT